MGCWYVFILLIIAIPGFLEIFIWRNQAYSAISNSDWSSFLGSYLGVVIGGTATLIAVWLTAFVSKMKLTKKNHSYKKCWKTIIVLGRNRVGMAKSGWLHDKSAVGIGVRWKESNGPRKERNQNVIRTSVHAVGALRSHTLFSIISASCLSVLRGKLPIFLTRYGRGRSGKHIIKTTKYPNTLNLN